MKNFIKAGLMLMGLMSAVGCAGNKNLSNNSLDGPRWGSTYKQLKSDYASATTAAARNAAIDAYSELAARSPNKAAADLVKKTLCPCALAEGRTDIFEGVCAGSEIATALLKR